MTSVLDRTIARQNRLERRTIRQRILNIALTVVTIIAVSGWLTSSLDHSAQKRNGDVADCRSAALADHLDGFQALVIPGATAADRRAAAEDLAHLPTLKHAYARCSTHPGGTP